MRACDARRWSFTLGMYSRHGRNPHLHWLWVIRIKKIGDLGILLRGLVLAAVATFADAEGGVRLLDGHVHLGSGRLALARWPRHFFAEVSWIISVFRRSSALIFLSWRFSSCNSAGRDIRAAFMCQI